MSGSIEGGMGYWMYTLETPHVKYMLPGSTSANYEVFGGTFLNDRIQDCTKLGGAVRISNRLLIPNDMIMFEPKAGVDADDTDGFLGYMLTRTPIGKRSDDDDANYWTIILDSENYSGPAMMMSAYFWDMRTNWDPLSASWSDPRSLMGYIAQGFEGGLGSFETTDGSKTWKRATKWGLPMDKDSTVSNPTSTLFSGHSQYNTDWAVAAMEPMLSGTGNVNDQTPSFIHSAAQSQRVKPACNLPSSDSSGKFMEEANDSEWIYPLGFGSVPADTSTAQTAADAASCHVQLVIDPLKFDCTTKSGWCLGRRYLSRETSQAGGTNGNIHADSDVPTNVKATLDNAQFVGTKKNDGRFLGPPRPTERPCFECPGPGERVFFFFVLLFLFCFLIGTNIHSAALFFFSFRSAFPSSAT